MCFGPNNPKSDKDPIRRLSGGMNRVEYILERVHGKVLHVGASTGPLHEEVRSRSERLFGLDLTSREGDGDVHQGRCSGRHAPDLSGSLRCDFVG